MLAVAGKENSTPQQQHPAVVEEETKTDSDDDVPELEDSDVEDNNAEAGASEKQEESVPNEYSNVKLSAEENARLQKIAICLHKDCNHTSIKQLREVAPHTEGLEELPVGYCSSCQNASAMCKHAQYPNFLPGRSVMCHDHCTPSRTPKLDPRLP
eukprot:337001-Rhodomonas_salina.1